MIRIPEEIRRQCVKFGYNNEDVHEIVATYCNLNDNEDSLLSIRNNVQMQDFIIKAINWWSCSGRGSLNGHTIADIRRNMRDSNSHIARQNQQRQTMRDLSMGKIPRRF